MINCASRDSDLVSRFDPDWMEVRRACSVGRVPRSWEIRRLAGGAEVEDAGEGVFHSVGGIGGAALHVGVEGGDYL